MIARRPALLTCFAVVFLSVICGCGQHRRDYSGWQNLPTEGWAYTDTVVLHPLDRTLPDNDSVAHGRVKIALRHDNDYPYSNIWLELSYFSVDGRQRRDTVKMVLADVYGRWLGSGISSGYQIETTACEGVDVDLTRPLYLRHILRVDTLRGVEQVGILVDQ